MKASKDSSRTRTRSNRVYDIVSIVTGFIACVFHILGASIPAWWELDEVDPRGLGVTFYFGVWWTRTCYEDGVCITETAKMSEERAWLIGPATLILLASVLLLTVVTLLVLTVIKSWDAHIRQLSVLLSGGSGGIIILAVLIFVKKKAGLLPSIAPDTSDGNPGWTLALSSTGGVLALVNAVIIGIGVAKNFRAGKPSAGHHLDMEISVNGSIPGHRSSTLSTHSSGNQGSRWHIEKKQQQQQQRRKDSGVVFFTPEYHEENDKL